LEIGLKKGKVIIIGGGVAGLSTGIYGQLNGFDTQIFEMHDKPGGQCTAWERGGYRFDYCLHWLIGTRRSIFHDIWKETGVIDDTVQIVAGEIHTLVQDDTRGEFIIYTDLDRWQDYLTKLAPEDEKGIRKMCLQMKMGARLEPFLKGPDVRKFSDYFKALLKMRKLLFMLHRYSKISAEAYFDHLKLKNPKLRFFLHKLYGEVNLSALVFIMMLGCFHDKNAGYLIGGSLPISLRMAERYRSLGGELLPGRKVKKILVDNNRAVGVKLHDGTIYEADYVISAADGHATLFDMLEGRYLSPKLREAYSEWDLYMPFVQVSFGVNDRLVSRSVVTTCLKERFTAGDLPFHHGYSIMNQSAIDPTLAPDGKTCIILKFDSEWEYWEKISPEEYKTRKEQIKTMGLEILERHFPGVREKIEVVDVSTPLTAVKFTGVWKGAYEGFLPTGNMIKKTLPNTLPKLKSFYMIGQWMFPGGGLPPAAQSGKWVMQTICRERKQKFCSDFNLNQNISFSNKG
jgi:phytoene dehydrogenase-like protein